VRIHLVAIACLLLTLNALAQEKVPQKTPAASLNADTAATEAHSRKLWEDFRTRNKTALSATLADGFRGIEEGGDFFDAKGYLSALDGFELKSYVLSDYVATPLGTGAVLINYHANYEGAAAGETTHGNAGFSEVWVRRGNNWKLQYLQETYVR
jgi:uncharacterized protein DUF4440